MSRIVEIKESDLVALIKTIIFEETEDQNDYYDLSPEQYYKLLRSVKVSNGRGNFMLLL